MSAGVREKLGALPNTKSRVLFYLLSGSLQLPHLQGRHQTSPRRIAAKAAPSFHGSQVRNQHLDGYLTLFMPL